MCDVQFTFHIPHFNYPFIEFRKSVFPQGIKCINLYISLSNNGILWALSQLFLLPRVRLQR